MTQPKVADAAKRMVWSASGTQLPTAREGNYSTSAENLTPGPGARVPSPVAAAILAVTQSHSDNNNTPL